MGNAVGQNLLEYRVRVYTKPLRTTHRGRIPTIETLQGDRILSRSRVRAGTAASLGLPLQCISTVNRTH